MGFVLTIKAWNQEWWDEIIFEAKEFLSDKKKGQVWSASWASLEAVTVDVEVKDFVMMLDEE